MWKKGELVWASSKSSNTWIPGQILDPSEPSRILVSFFGLSESRYVPLSYLRSFERDFGTLISGSGKQHRRHVNRAMRVLFWNISFGLWCSCQPPINSPYFDSENSLPRVSLRFDSALGFVRDMAISHRVPLRRLAETNTWSAQILSFRRYTVDFQRSQSVYEEIRESAKLMDHAEEPNWCLDDSNEMDSIALVSMLPEAANPDVENIEDLNLTDPLPKDIHCYSSPSAAQPVEKAAHINTWNTKNPLTESNSSSIRACETMARSAGSGYGHPSKSRERCLLEQSICLPDSTPAIQVITEEDATTIECSKSCCVGSSGPPVADSIELHDVLIETHDVLIETHDDIICLDDGTATSAKQLPNLLDAENSKALLINCISCTVTEIRETPACSVKETYDTPENKPESSMSSAKTFIKETSDRNTFTGAPENCSNDALESKIVEVGQVSPHMPATPNRELSSDDTGIAPAEQLLDLDAAITVENQTCSVDNNRSIRFKRKRNQNRASARNSKRKKKSGKQSVSTDKPLNLNLLKAMSRADPKCLRMKFLSSHSTLPSKAELLKRFSVFGKIDRLRTDVDPQTSSAKVVFLQSIDAVTAYQFARSKKFSLGWSKVTYRLDPFEQEDSEVNQAPTTEKSQESVPRPKSCLRKHGLADNEEERRNLKVRFRMETNS